MGWGAWASSTIYFCSNCLNSWLSAMVNGFGVSGRVKNWEPWPVAVISHHQNKESEFLHGDLRLTAAP